jgi:hypothetical protein
MPVMPPLLGLSLLAQGAATAAPLPTWTDREVLGVIGLTLAVVLPLTLVAVWLTWRVARAGMPSGGGAPGGGAGLPASGQALPEGQLQELKDRLVREALESIEADLARRAQERKELLENLGPAPPAPPGT